jgi:hypothetical protein
MTDPKSLLSFTFESVAAEQARRWIEEHDAAVTAGEIVNRRRKPAAVRQIKADIVAGQWFPNTGETIKWERNGHGDERHGRLLVDGQTRLDACAQAGQSIQVWMVSGVAREAFVYIDSGDRRSLSDVLRIKGEGDSLVLASTLNYLCRWDSTADTFNLTNARNSHASATKLLESDPAIRKSVARVRDVKLMGRGAAAALHRVFTRRDPALADRLVDAIAIGDNLISTDPFYVLRERLIAETLSRRRLQPPLVMALVVKAWNAAREGKSIMRLNLKAGERIGKVE